VLWNRSRTHALGGTVLLALDGSGADVGLRVRYRRWLTSDGLALDLSAGPTLVSYPFSGGFTSGQTVALGAEAALNLRDYVAVVARAEAARVNQRTPNTVMLGTRIGSKPAAITAGTGLVLFGVLILMLASADFGG
jgi:hypothetical protein